MWSQRLCGRTTTAAMGHAPSCFRHSSSQEARPSLEEANAKQMAEVSFAHPSPSRFPRRRLTSFADPCHGLPLAVLHVHWLPAPVAQFLHRLPDPAGDLCKQANTHTHTHTLRQPCMAFERLKDAPASCWQRGRAEGGRHLEPRRGGIRGRLPPLEGFRRWAAGRAAGALGECGSGV